MAKTRVLAVTPRPVASLVPYAGNARTHSREQVEQIARFVEEVGWTNPILVDENLGIIAGHARLEVAKLLGMSEVPTIMLTGLTAVQRRALVLADNRLAEVAGWDENLLRTELQALADADFDLSLMGWSDEELADLLDAGGGGLTHPDDVPPVPEQPVSRPGDLWVLGGHRVICGDAIDPAVLARLMAGEKAQAAWTDPPYNVNYKSKAGKIKNDDQGDAEFRQFLRKAFTTLFGALQPGASIYVAHADTEGLNFRGAFREAGFKLSGVLIWRKDALVLGRSDYQWIHEPVMYGWHPGASHRWFGGRQQTTVAEVGDGSPFRQRADGRWEVEVDGAVFIVDGAARVEAFEPTVLEEPRPKRSDLHPTMKPTALIERMLRNSAKAGDTVIDPFGGSGSTLIAAHELGMRGRLVELDPVYCDVIVTRWQNFTGEEATLEGDGRTFSELQAERVPAREPAPVE